MRAPSMATAMLAATIGTAHAHPGEHARMPLSEIAQHLAEPDHLAFIALAAIVGGVTYRWSRRTAVHVQTLAHKSHEDRS